MITGSSRLFVGNLAKDVVDEDLRDLFTPFGVVLTAEVIRDHETDVSRGFAFVQMATDAAGAAALEKLDRSEFRGKRLRIKVAAPKKPGGYVLTPTPQLMTPTPQLMTPTPQVLNPPPQATGPTPPTGEVAAPPARILEPPLTEAAPPTRISEPPLGATPISPAAPPPGVAPVAHPARQSALWAAGAAVAVLIVGGATWLMTQTPRADASTVLIVPLDVIEESNGAEYVGYAMAQALAVNLATVPELRVLPVPATTELGGRGATERADTAVAAGAGRLVMGTITRNPDGVHVSITLVDATQNRILWGVQRDARGADDMALASTLAHELASQLGQEMPRQVDHVLNLTGGPAMAIAPETAAALDALRRGEVAAGLSATERLLARFPSEPAAVALRTHALLLQWDAARSPETFRSFSDSLVALEKTNLASAYAEFYRAYVLYGEGRDEEAVERFTRILDRHQLSPWARAWVLRYRAIGHQRMGQVDRALTELRESQQLDPTNAWTLSILSEVLRLAGQPKDALVAAQQGLALAPGYWRNHQQVGEALSSMGKTAEAAEAFGRECALNEAQLSCSRWALELMKAGRKDEAKKAAERASAMLDNPIGHYNLACFLALAGDKPGALQELQLAVDAGLAERSMADDPDLNSLRETPEFRSLLAVVQSRLRRPDAGAP